MGVKGLTTFIDNHPSLLKDYQLHSCKVIFDGNNLYHFLYHRYNIRQQFNGDYFNYAKKVKQVFVNLRKCGIVPYVVFDGGYNTDDKKHQTVLERARDRLRISGKNSFRGSKNLLPILSYETFKTVLDDLGAFHVTCDYEADEHIAILANKWNCPIISNDSDFYVYNIKAGFLPMDYVDFRIKQKFTKDVTTGRKRSQLYILVQKYHLDHYSDVFGKFNPSFIPLLATILGNDFVNGKVFSYFMKKFKKPDNKKSKLSSKRSKAYSLISWFKRCASAEDAIQQILDHFPPERRPFLEKTIQDSIYSYIKIDSDETFLEKYFESEFDVNSVKLNDYFGNSLPEWMMNSLLKAELSPFIQNALVLRRVILQCQVEDLRKASSHEISKSIRRVMYGILFNSPPGTETITENRDCQIEEYDRKTRVVGKTYTLPITQLSNFGQVLNIIGLPIVTIDKRQEMIMDVLEAPSDFVTKFSPSLQLLVCVAAYWAKYAGIPKYHLAALLLNVILLHLTHFCMGKSKETDDKLEVEKDIEDCNSRSSHYDEDDTDDVEVKAMDALERMSLDDTVMQCKTIDFDLVFQSIPISILTGIRCSLSKEINNLPSITWKYEWPPRLSHCYSQLQSCLLYAINLNQLLLCPFRDPVIPKSYDGSTLFLISKAMQSKQNYLLYAYKMLGGNFELCKLYKNLLDTVCETVGEEVFIETYTMKRRRKKDEKTQFDRSVDVDVSEMSCESSDSESSHDDVSDISDMSIDCDISNRFSLL